MKAKVRLIDNLQEKHCTTDNQNTIGRCNELTVGRVYWYNIAYTKIRKMQGKIIMKTDSKSSQSTMALRHIS